MNAGKALGNVALSPFWLLGRAFAAVAAVAVWIWDAFMDGVNAGTRDDETVGGFVGFLLVWVVVLTVLVVLR